MDKERGQIMTCDFDLVLREQQVAQPATQQPASQPARSARGLALLLQSWRRGLLVLLPMSALQQATLLV